MSKIKILNNKVIKTAQSEVLPGSENTENDSVNIEELREVLGESLDVSQNLYNDVLEENLFGKSPTTPAAEMKPEEKQVQGQQQRPRLRRGHKDMNRKLLYAAAKSPALFSQCSSPYSVASQGSDDDEDDDFMTSPKSVMSLFSDIKKQCNKLLNKFNMEETKLKGELNRMEKRRNICVKRLQEIEKGKKVVASTLKNLKFK